MDERRIPGEVSAAAHAFPDHGLASSADRPPVQARQARTRIDDPEAEGRLWPQGAAGGEVPAGAGGGTYVGPQVPFAHRGPLAADGGASRARRPQPHPAADAGRGAAEVDAGAIGVLRAYAGPDAGPPAGPGPGPDAGPDTGAHQRPDDRWPARREGRPYGGPDDSLPAQPDDRPPGGPDGPGGRPHGRDADSRRGARAQPPAAGMAGRARREVWTDLAVEAVQPPERIPGVAVEEDHRGLLQISRVRIESEEAELRVGKRRGHYITLEAPGLRRRNAALQEDTARALADELRGFLPDSPDAEVLVVGLGNWHATPDALGPRVIGDLLITRHLRGQVPEDLRGGLRSLCAVAPGVLGTTGIETGEIIRAIIDRIHPDAMIAVDALASRSIDRIAATIQLADTGIHPGSGVGNDRGDLSAETLGLPVIAIGVPTVVHAFTIASDTVDLLIRRIPRRPEFAGLRAMGGEEKRRLIAEVLTPSVGDLMVTPKEVDVLIEDMSRIIAAGINAAVHPKIAQQPALF